MWGVCSEVQEQILSLEPDTNLAAVADVGRDIKKSDWQKGITWIQGEICEKIARIKQSHIICKSIVIYWYYPSNFFVWNHVPPSSHHLLELVKGWAIPSTFLSQALVAFCRRDQGPTRLPRKFRMVLQVLQGGAPAISGSYWLPGSFALALMCSKETCPP